MNYSLITRALLRLLALGLVSWGLVDEGAAAVIYTDPDLVAAATLAVSEAFFAVSKWVESRRNRVIIKGVG